MQYLTVTETAKLVRKALKEAFPGTKFSVRCSQYAGGASMNIGWTDGPSVDQVKAIAGRFEGSYFDGMIDYKGSIYAEMNGEPVQFGGDFIFYQRECTPECLAEARAKYEALDGQAQCDLWNSAPPAIKGFDGEFTDRALASLLMTVEPQPSTTADSVAITGSDGYGQTGFGPGKAYQAVQSITL